MKIVQLNRRDFLKSSALMGSGLTLGLSGFAKLATADTVSYTHLTLPTIYSV